MPPSESDTSKPKSIALAASTGSAFEPLKHPVFRSLWCVWLFANLSMWMNDVAAAWMMTSLTQLPIWVALVQTASTLPVFLFGLPSGALADILDRRRYFLITQFWVAGVSTILVVAILSGVMTPPLLLVLTFAYGVGLAMRWPVFSAIIPELVPRPQLPSALALNGVSMNVSRIVGPLVAGAIIAGAGSEFVFMLNAALSLASAVIILRWKHVHVPSKLGRERLLRAMSVGVQFVWHSARLKAALAKVFVFFFHLAAVMGLLPVVARDFAGGKAGTFTLLLAAMGAGAIVTAVFLPRVRQLMSRDRVVLLGTALQAVATVVVAMAPNVYVCAAGMVMTGIALISTSNSLIVSAQLALPDWVRARGMAIFQMGLMGGSASGAALWGQVATVGDLQLALLASSVSGILAMLIVHRVVVDKEIEEDLTPSRAFTAPVTENPPGSGNVVVTIEYRIHPFRAKDFRLLMQESRRSRLRQGALSWELLRDIGDPGRYIERIVDDSWTEHLRRFDRVTAADVSLRERKLAFHIGDGPPAITRMVVDETAG